MIVKKKTISAAQAAAMLFDKLGALRNWADFLADNIRGKQSINGLELLPCARKHDGKSLRPVYSIDDVKDFIDKVLALESTEGKAPLKPTTLLVDTGKHWTVNKFKGDGSPFTYRSSAGFRCRAHHSHLRHPVKVTKTSPFF